MSELTIQIPEGFKVESFDAKTGRVTLAPKPLDPVGRLATFEEVCEEAGVNPGDYETDSSDPMTILLNQVNRAGLLSKVFNCGEELDAANTDQKKWFPVYEHSKSGFRFYYSIFTYSDALSVLGPLLGFKDERTCDYVGRTFLQEYKKIHFPISK